MGNSVINDKIHVVYMRSNLEDDYNRHTAASIASVLENCSKPVVIHIIYEQENNSKLNHLVEENIKKYRNLVSKYSAEIEFHPIVIPEWWDKRQNSLALRRFPHILLGRFYIQELFYGINYVISLGSDTIVKMDIADIFKDIDGNKPIYSVLDTLMISNIKNNGLIFKTKYTNYVVERNMDTEIYVCTDVCIFNLKYMKEHCINLLDMATEFMKKYDNILLGDQDITNAIFRNMIGLLPERYDIYVYLDDANKVIEEAIKENMGYIIHYAGGPKPWHSYTTKYDYEYWNYLSLTSWFSRDDFFKEMGKVIYTEADCLSNLNEFLWSKPITQKIKYCFSIPMYMYIGLIQRYIKKYIKKND